MFPELDKGRSGDSLEARFNAFKIPESNFLVFEATVRTCRDGCQPVSISSQTRNITAFRTTFVYPEITQNISLTTKQINLLLFRNMLLLHCDIIKRGKHRDKVHYLVTGV